MKFEKQNGRRILMAVDLKSAERQHFVRSWKTLAPMLRKEDRIQPVAILDRADAAVGNIIRSSIGKIRLAAQRHLGEEVKRLRDERIVDPVVLFADGSSTRRAVSAILRHAQKSGADLIAVGTHSRTGVKRFFLGSFAETLAIQATTPILVMNPRTKSKASLRSVLYATDFSERSRQGLEVLCRSFESSKPRIILFHSFVPFTGMYVEPFFAGSLPEGTLKTLTDDEFENLRRTGEKWCAAVRSKGYPVELQFGRKSMYVDEQILSAARRQNVGMIALTSMSGEVASAVLGSTTRQLLRESPLPVWVVHPAKRRRTAGTRSPRLKVAN